MDNAFEAPVSAGVFTDKKIREASGLVASINNPGMLWTHNDSGNSPDIFLIDQTGEIKCTVHVSGVKNRDWEDITIGSGPEQGKTYLYIGEIGDNAGIYSEKFLYRLEEPRINGGISDTTVKDVEKIEFRLSDGQRDSEALMIDPVSKDFYIFSKREANVNLYKLTAPLSTTKTMIAQRVLEKLPFTLVVASDISKDGSEILVKNYDNVFYWKRLPGKSVETTVKQTPVRLPYASEPQGESIAFSSTGDGYYTLSERKNKMSQHLYFYKRTVVK